MPHLIKVTYRITATKELVEAANEAEAYYADGKYRGYEDLDPAAKPDTEESLSTKLHGPFATDVAARNHQAAATHGR